MNLLNILQKSRTATRSISLHTKLLWSINTLEIGVPPNGWTIIRKREYWMAVKLNWRYSRDTKRLFPSGILWMKRLWFFEMHWCSNGWLSNCNREEKKYTLERINPWIRWYYISVKRHKNRSSVSGSNALNSEITVILVVQIYMVLIYWIKDKTIFYYFI